MVNTVHQLDHKVISKHASALPSFVETITDSLYEGVLLLDGALRVTFANETAALLLGQTPQTLHQRPLTELLPQEKIDLFRQSSGHHHKFQHTFQLADGRELPASVTLTALPFTVEGFSLMSIAALPHADQWTEKMIHSERLAGIGTMTASIAHELINPISVIGTTASTLIEMLEAQETNNEEIARFLAMIDANVGRCNRLIETLRAYTYGEVMREPTAINDLIEQAVTMLGAQIEKQDNLRLNIELNPELPTVVCDPGQITQVLINLMLNARDAMLPGGGEIVLRTWMIPELSSIAFSVQDTGKGLPGDDEINRLFEPFYTTKQRGKGTGLGLFIASQIVKQHNGWIRAQNRVDADQSVSGAQFTVTLPL